MKFNHSESLFTKLKSNDLSHRKTLITHIKISFLFDNNVFHFRLVLFYAFRSKIH